MILLDPIQCADPVDIPLRKVKKVDLNRVVCISVTARITIEKIKNNKFGVLVDGELFFVYPTGEEAFKRAHALRGMQLETNDGYIRFARPNDGRERGWSGWR